MKKLGQKNISALIALLLAGTILTSVSAQPTDPQPLPSASDSISFKEDLSYMEDVQAYIDDYMASMESPVFEEPEMTVKVFDIEGNLVLQGLKSDLSDAGLKIFRQANYLSERHSTSYYMLSN